MYWVMHQNLDPQLLRTFVAIAECGSLARAGERVGRAQPTVSLQVKRLEVQIGATLFGRDGRKLVLTEEGRRLLHYARRILALNEEARLAVSASALSGALRLGTIQDLAEPLLPQVLGRFAATHPGVRLEVRVDSSSNLARAVAADGLDLAIYVGQSGARARTLGREAMAWIAPEHATVARKRPLPLVLCDMPCRFRETALGLLDDAGIAWRIAFTSPSLAGVTAALHAGLGVTVRGTSLLGEGLVSLDGQGLLPPLPEFEIVLERAPATRGAAVDVLEGLIATSLHRAPLPS